MEHPSVVVVCAHPPSSFFLGDIEALQMLALPVIDDVEVAMRLERIPQGAVHASTFGFSRPSGDRLVSPPPKEESERENAKTNEQTKCAIACSAPPEFLGRCPPPPLLPFLGTHPRKETKKMFREFFRKGKLHGRPSFSPYGTDSRLTTSAAQSRACGRATRWHHRENQRRRCKVGHRSPSPSERARAFLVPTFFPDDHPRGMCENCAPGQGRGTQL